MNDSGVHLFVDLASGGESSLTVKSSVESLASADSLGSFVDSASILVPLSMRHENFQIPANWVLVATDHPLEWANVAFESAADTNRHVLVTLGPIAITSEAAAALLNAFAVDPHFGVSIARQRDLATGELMKLDDDLGDSELRALSPRVLSEIPEYYILPELLAPCFLIRNVVVNSLPLLDQSFRSLNGALQLYLLRSRRAGFRTAVWNRAVICRSFSTEIGRPFVPRHDIRQLFSQYADAARAQAEVDEHVLHRYESMLGRLYSPNIHISKTLLLDLRGMPRHVNGTVEAILGFCTGLRSIDHDWTITLWAEDAPAAYHRLRDRYPDWTVLVTPPKTRFYTAAFRPSQPWHMNTLMELHDAALTNFYAMLDTISWDTLFESLRGLSGCWDFMSQQSDGLLYISADTRNHVERRFPAASTTPGHVLRLSCNPQDYRVEKALSESRDERYTFVIGNSYDHKNLAPTVDLLSSAFPFEVFKVLGMKGHPNPRVQTLESGQVTESAVESLFAGARFIVFPSLYEGFGFPVLKGMSYGATVFARASDLLSEIAAHYAGPGSLLAYSSPAELVDLLARSLHDEPVNAMLLGTALAPGEAPEDWAGVARGLLTFIERQTTGSGKSRWLQRASVIRQIQAFCG